MSEEQAPFFPSSHKALRMTQLPCVVKQSIASYLHYQDAAQLSEVHPSLFADLRLSRLEPAYELTHSQLWMGRLRDDVPQRGEEIPCLSARTHSILLQCTWKDQGWGIRKGRMYIVAEPGEKPTNSQLFGGGTVVWESPLAFHEATQLTMTFNPEKGVRYFMWYSCGGGGGHVIAVEHLVMYTMVFDDDGKNLSHTYKRLCEMTFLQSDETGVLESDEDGDSHIDNEDILFSMHLLVTIVHCILLSKRQKERPTSPFGTLEELLIANNLPTHSPFLESLELVCNFFLQYLGLEPSLIPATTNQGPIDTAPNVAVLPPFQLSGCEYFEGENNSRMEGKFFKVIRIPIIAGRTKHVEVRCRWDCKGGEVPTGKLRLVSQNSTPQSWQPKSRWGSEPLTGGRVLCESPTASRETSSLVMEFGMEQVHENEEVYLCQLPPLDGSFVVVNDLEVVLTIVDDASDSVKQIFDNPVMNDQDRGFPFRLLLATTMQLLDGTSFGDEKHQELLDVFQRYGLPTHVEGLDALQDIVRCAIEVNGHDFIEKKGHPPTSIHTEDWNDAIFPVYTVM